MSSLNALSVSIAVLAFVATWLVLGPLAGFVVIWAVFIAWGGFFALGGDDKALKNLIICGIFGVIMAWISAVVILAVPLATVLGLPVWAGIVVGVAVLILCLAANTPLLAAIPATVFGYASTFAYLLQTPDRLALDALTSFSASNPLLLISLSLILGTLFGWASGKIPGMIPGMVASAGDA